MRDKKSFVMYTDWNEIMEELTDNQCGELLRAIYALEMGKEYQFKDQVVKGVFLPIKMQLNKDGKKYAEICEKRSEARSGIKSNQMISNDNNCHQMISNDNNCHQMISNDIKSYQETPDNDNENDNDNEDENENENEYGNEKEDENVIGFPSADLPRIIQQEWNALPNVRKFEEITMNSFRYNLILNRVGIEGIDKVRRAMNRIRDSEFLQGNNDRGWKIDIEWFLREENFYKVLEGNYDTTTKPKPKGKANFTERKTDYSELERRMLHAQLH